MGGYGLFGIILDLDVDMVENRLMRPRSERDAGRRVRRALHHGGRRSRRADDLWPPQRVARATSSGGEARHLSRRADAEGRAAAGEARSAPFRSCRAKSIARRSDRRAPRRTRWFAENVAARRGSGLRPATA